MHKLMNSDNKDLKELSRQVEEIRKEENWTLDHFVKSGGGAEGCRRQQEIVSLALLR